MGCIWSQFKQRTAHPAPNSESSQAIRPASICNSCWQGPFSAQMGLGSEELESHSNGAPAKGGYKYISSWNALASQAKAGCRWCHFLLGARVEEENVESSEPMSIILGYRGYRSFAVVINDRQRFGGFLSAEADDPAAEFVTYRPLVLDVGSARASNLSKECLANCVATHLDCPQPVQHPLPTRLIDCSDPRHPKLVATGGGLGNYAALSYVWGGPQVQSTKRSNLHAYLQSLHLASLPQTIVDAISVTHQIGLAYLWVDSLCIIQDDDEDKLKELTRMRLVYRNAYITICAANSRGVSEGFLADRPYPHPALTPSYGVTLPFICPHESQTIGQIQVQLLWVNSILPDIHEYDPSMEPVNSRAWCFQEFALSPRILIFATHTLQFWCRRGLVNIGGSENTASYRTYLPDALLDSGPPPDIVVGSDVWNKVRTSWTEMLKDYSSRSSTLPQDRLVAIAGVAEEFGRVLRTPYLAGLWEDALLAGLLWNKATKDCLMLPRPHKYRAPSWSWASVDGGVHAGPVLVKPNESVAEVISCEVTLQTDSLAFGQVVGGVLKIRAPLALCLLDASSPPQLYWIKHQHPQDIHQYELELAATDKYDDLDVERIGICFHDSSDDLSFKMVYAMPVHVAQGLGFFHSSPSGDPVDWVRQVPITDCTIS
ncbi:hypothetical protein ONZ45_g10616 [Pleurotus djamor]|nr:hypothetical protein ONZ45_g10616 [Pleurotus djamor]